MLQQKLDISASESNLPAWFGAVDTRLIAAVQGGAGARCHEAANLLQAYYNCAQVYRLRLQRRKEQAQEAWSTLQQARTRLRKFLSECQVC